MKNDDGSMLFCSWPTWDQILALPLNNCLSFLIYVHMSFRVSSRAVLVHRKINHRLALFFKIIMFFKLKLRSENESLSF